MSIDIRYANQAISERFVKVLLDHFNDELENMTIDPLPYLPALERVFETGFDLGDVKRMFSNANVVQTAIFVEQQNQSIYDTDLSCSPTMWARDRTVPYKVTLIQKVETAERSPTHQLNDNDNRMLSIEEIAKKRGDLYVGLMNYVVNKYLKDSGVSVSDVFTTSDINLGSADDLPDFGLLLFCELTFDVKQTITLTIGN